MTTTTTTTALRPVAPLPCDATTLAALERAAERPGTLPAHRAALLALRDALRAAVTAGGRGESR
jgi:hypothetical protein